MSPRRRAEGATPPEADLRERLDHERAVWLCTLRPDGSPHQVPVWFFFDGAGWWIATAAASVKMRNVGADPRVSLALPDPDAPVVADGTAVVVDRPFPTRWLLTGRAR